MTQVSQRRPGRARLFKACLVAASLAAGPAHATDVNVSSTTLLSVRPDWRSGEGRNMAPLIEWVGLNARGIDNPWIEELGVQVAAWGRADPIDFRDKDAVAGDVDLAYVHGKALDKRLSLTLGRQFLVGGAARAISMDGLNADVKVAGGVGISAYGGAPVIPRFAVGLGDVVTGSRLYWKKSFETELGASVIQLVDRGLVARRDVGLDGRYTLFSRLVLNGNGQWSLIENRLAEGELSASYRLRNGLEVSASYRRTAPDLFIPRSSIFSVFSQMERTEAGGGVFWKPLDKVLVYADYHAILDENDTGHDLFARVNVRPSRRLTLGLEGRRLTLAENGYTRGRAFCLYRLSPYFTLSADAETTRLARAVNGLKDSTVGSASASFEFAPGWQAVVSGAGGTTPFFERRFEFTGKLVYAFASSTKGTEQ